MDWRRITRRTSHELGGLVAVGEVLLFLTIFYFLVRWLIGEWP